MKAEEFESKFFIDSRRFNCPYCHVRSIGFIVIDLVDFDWSDITQAHAYFAKCLGCEKISIHLSHFRFSYNKSYPQNIFDEPPSKYKNDQTYPETYYLQPDNKHNENSDFYGKGEILDEYFFYHHPSSPFAVDPNVPSAIRGLIEEADACRKQNFLVGASGALRKAIYEFLLDQKVEGESYEDKIKALKVKYPKAEESIFDALAGVQDLTSVTLHENEIGNWEPWKDVDFNYVMQVVKASMYEVYTSPKRSQEWLTKINSIKSSRKKN